VKRRIDHIAHQALRSTLRPFYVHNPPLVDAGFSVPRSIDVHTTDAML
jgi:hypothetical protein